MNDIEEKIEEVETLHVYPMQGGIFITKEEATEPVIESTPTNKKSPLYSLIPLLLCSALLIGSLAILPSGENTKQLTIRHNFTIPGDLQSQMIPPVTMRQSITVATTGKGHADATRAHGYLVVYNGAFSAQDIPANMIFTAANGVEVVTDTAVTIPAGNPPNYGVATVSAHSIQSGTVGNINPYEIDIPCCFSALKVVNETSFTGGKNARDFNIVTMKEIDRGVTSLTQSLYRQAQTALQTGLTPDDAIIALPCSSTVATSYRIGQEAVNVKVLETVTCSAIMYSQRDLQDKARELVHVPTGYVLTRVAIHRISTTLTSNQKSATIVISITLGYNSLVRKGIAK